MSTAFSFTRRLDMSEIPAPVQSVGAHLSAKLEMFQTDERTLTDELCDMLCIWLGMPGHSPAPSTSSLAFSLFLSKTTTAEEVNNGADLELIVSSPLGRKRCLIQAKVLDPSTGRLRCDSKVGWMKLRKQLVAARKDAGDLAFLLVYVPGSMLDGSKYGFSTYEQAFAALAPGKPSSYFGATLIAVDDLLGAGGRWRSKKFKVRQTQPGLLKAGVPFWRLLLELLLCRRSTWSTDHAQIRESSARAFRSLAIGAGEIDQTSWQQIQGMADQWLRSDEAPDGGRSTS
jgi:hypothetical protein